MAIEDYRRATDAQTNLTPQDVGRLIRHHRRQALINALIFTAGVAILVSGLFLALDLISLRDLATASRNPAIIRLIFALRFRFPPQTADPYEVLAAGTGALLMVIAVVRETRAWLEMRSSSDTFRLM